MASVAQRHLERSLLRLASRCSSSSSSSSNSNTAGRSYSSLASTRFFSPRPLLFSRRGRQEDEAVSGKSHTRSLLCLPTLQQNTAARATLRSLHTTPPPRSAASSTRTVDYLLADVGEGITECEIVKWFVEPGSMVEEFDILVEVQSDKASVEITSRYAGRVKEHCYKVGEVAKVGSPLCTIEVEVEGEAAAEEEKPVAAAAAAAREEGEATSATSEKAEETTNTRDAESTKADAKPHDVSSSANATFSDGKGSTLATPAVRRVVREHGIDIDKVQGTGKAGRVTKEDVQGYVNSQASSSSLSSSSAPSTLSDDERTITLTGTRKAMFKAMSTTWRIPHFGYSDEIDVTRLDAIRKEMQAALMDSKRRGGAGGDDKPVKLTLLPFLLKALSLALYRHALFRSTLEEASMSLTEKQRHCISIALSSPRGLLTPTLPGDVRQASILDLAEQIHSLQRISSERGLNQKEMGSGATVTLSNIGNIGGTFTFPLIPPTGQLVIGAIGRSRLLPRFDDRGDLTKALILPASFSADHRVVEGTELASFVQEWKELIERPSSWLLQMR